MRISLIYYTLYYSSSCPILPFCPRKAPSAAPAGPDPTTRNSVSVAELIMAVVEVAQTVKDSTTMKPASEGVGNRPNDIHSKMSTAFEMVVS